jgi:hypothetical protein
VAGEARRDLGVEQRGRPASARPFEDLQVLFGRVGDHDSGPGQDGAEASGVDRQRIDEGHASRAGVAVRPRHLDQGQARPVRTLAVELGVERVAARSTEAVHE